MNRLPYLNAHMRSLNHSPHNPFPRWLALYALAVTVLCLELAWLRWEHQNSLQGHSVRSEAIPERTVDLIWRQETQGGIPVKKKDGKLSFVF